jgi:membrane-associated protease RseP (regulator of RpoE activity)
MRLLANLLGWLFAIWLYVTAVQRDFPGGWLTYLALTSLIGILVTLVHESGHALVARRLGARLIVFAVGQLQYHFGPGRWHWRRERNREVGGFVAYALPPHRETSRNHLLIAAAGPLANLACAALVAVLLAIAASHNSERSRPAIEAVTVTAGPATTGSASARLPDARAIDRALELYRAQRAGNALRHHLETLAILLVMASLGAAVVNLLPFDDSDGAVIKAHWRS